MLKIIRDGNKVTILKGGDPYRGAVDSVMCCFGRKMMDGKIEGRCRTREIGAGGVPQFREYGLRADDGINLKSCFALAAMYGSVERVLLFYDKVEGDREILIREEFVGDRAARKETCVPLERIDRELFERYLVELGGSSWIERPSLIDLAAELRMPCDFYNVIKPFLACHREETYTSHPSGRRDPRPRLTFGFLSVGGSSNLSVDYSESLKKLKECLSIEPFG